MYVRKGCRVRAYRYNPYVGTSVSSPTVEFTAHQLFWNPMTKSPKLVDPSVYL